MPPESYLATGLVTVAAICGPRLFIQFSAAKRERCNLWLLNVGRSALARKTTGASALKWAIKKVAAEVLDDQIRWYSAKRASAAAMAKDLDVVSVDTERARKAESAAAKEEGREPSEIAACHRPVPVSWVLSLNEVAPLWGEHLSDWKQETQACMLDIFDGELASTTRQTAVPDQETFVCAIGNIPPAELSARTTFGQISSGFAGRWLMMPTPGPVEPISFPNLNGREPMGRLAGRIKAMAVMADRTPPLDVRTLWTEEALEVHHAWYVDWWQKLNRASAESQEDSARADLWNRLQATAKKVATLVAITRQLEGMSELHHVRVEGEDVVWAQERTQASISGLLDVVSQAGGGASGTLGKIENRVLHYLSRKGAIDAEEGVPFTTVARMTKGSDSYGEVIRALEGLIGTGMLGFESGVIGPKGGRPARVVWISG